MHELTRAPVKKKSRFMKINLARFMQIAYFSPVASCDARPGGTRNRLEYEKMTIAQLLNSNSPTLATSRTARGNGAVSYKSRTGPIDPDHLRAIAPSIFAEQAHGSRSEKYAYIPTSIVLERLRGEGFEPYAVSQGGSRDEAKRGFTKHLLRLRHRSAELQVGNTFSEIVLLNSHDGTSSYRLMGGVYRCACANGLVVAQSTISDIRIAHKGDVAGAVLDGCIDILDRLPEVSDSIAQMSSLRLSESEKHIFARAALIARYGDDESPVTPDAILSPRRREDVASDLWTVFNTAQENITKGGLHYIQRDDSGRRVARRQTREIRGVDQNTSVNRALWTLAEEMRALKTA